MADSVKTEGEDYIRVSAEAPPAVILPGRIRGEITHEIWPVFGDPGPADRKIRCELSHQISVREYVTISGEVLEVHPLPETITVGLSHVIT